jgi:hypothetical protein
MVVMMIVLVGLGTIAGLTVISVQSGSATTTNQRFNSIAVYAAESGAASAMDFLRKNFDPVTLFSAYVTQNNNAPTPPLGIPGNTIVSGGVGNILSGDQQSWYTVLILNNPADPGFATAGPAFDTDGIVTIHVTGHGPNGAVAELVWEVQTDGDATLPRKPLTLLGWQQKL